MSSATDRKLRLKAFSNYTELGMCMTDKERMMLSAQRRFMLEQGTINKRGNVTGFSYDSRQRLLQLLYKLRLYECDGRYMITLTYGKEFPEWKDAKRHLDRFCEHFLKRYFKKDFYWFAVWRLEIQRRDVPHFHIVLYTGAMIDMFALYEKALSYWMNLIGLYSPQYAQHSVHIKAGFCMSYIAGHTGKENQVRDWHVGRWWGVVNRKCLDMSAFEVFEDLEFWEYYKILRVLRKYKEKQIAQTYARRGIQRKVKVSRKNTGIKCILPIGSFQFQLKKWIKSLVPF